MGVTEDDAGTEEKCGTEDEDGQLVGGLDIGRRVVNGQKGDN